MKIQKREDGKFIIVEDNGEAMKDRKKVYDKRKDAERALEVLQPSGRKTTGIKQ